MFRTLKRGNVSATLEDAERMNKPVKTFAPGLVPVKTAGADDRPETAGRRARDPRAV